MAKFASTREIQIGYIVHHQYPALSIVGLAQRHGSEPGLVEVIAATEMLRDELSQLSDTELEARYQGAKAVEDKLAAEKAEKLEAGRSFNQPQARADFSHWAKCSFWTIEEAVAVTLGRDPAAIHSVDLNVYVTVSPFVMRYARLLDLARRAVGWKQLSPNVAPGNFLTWAKRYDIEVPAELEQAVGLYGKFLGDWKTLYDGARQRELEAAQLAVKLNAEVEAQLKTIEALKSAQASSAKSSKGGDPREIESLRKLCIGMAVTGYKYDPAAKRSDRISEIVGDLASLGISLDADTVRRHLKAGAELLPREALEKPEK